MKNPAIISSSDTAAFASLCRSCIANQYIILNKDQEGWRDVQFPLVPDIHTIDAESF